MVIKNLPAEVAAEVEEVEAINREKIELLRMIVVVNLLVVEVGAAEAAEEEAAEVEVGEEAIENRR